MPMIHVLLQNGVNSNETNPQSLTLTLEEAASIWSKLHRAREASVQLRQLLVARDAADGRAQLALLAQLERVDAPGMLELKGWMQNHGHSEPLSQSFNFLDCMSTTVQRSKLEPEYAKVR